MGRHCFFSLHTLAPAGSHYFFSTYNNTNVLLLQFRYSYIEVVGNVTVTVSVRLGKPENVSVAVYLMPALSSRWQLLVQNKYITVTGPLQISLFLLQKILIIKTLREANSGLTRRESSK